MPQRTFASRSWPVVAAACCALAACSTPAAEPATGQGRAPGQGVHLV